MTDQGLFEHLATTILRAANPSYAALVHTGTNVDRKTVKGPLDGLCFVPGVTPPHFVAVHHTITARTQLHRKWLRDGDVPKTLEIVSQERKHHPTLRATLVLTTNREPTASTVRALTHATRPSGIDVDIWSRSRLAHYLDNYPTGHWIRHQFLHITQRLLSPELLHELSCRSLEHHRPIDDPKAWIPRLHIAALHDCLHRNVTFVVGGAGQGKSVACYQALLAHVTRGGCGIIVPQDAVVSATTLEQAILATLRQLHPSLTDAGHTALALCSSQRPLLVVVEDINHISHAQFQVIKIAKWGRPAMNSTTAPLHSATWRILCPLRPHALSLLDDQARQFIEPLVFTVGCFTNTEGRDAVLARARLCGHTPSSSTATSIAQKLGNDPLLIALHDFRTTPDPHHVIGQFIDASVRRTAATNGDYLPTEYRRALSRLACEMLRSRTVDLCWTAVAAFPALSRDTLGLIASIAHYGELLGFAGPTSDERVVFRHDRVRDCLLVDAVAELARQGELPDFVLSDPYFAEILGTALACRLPNSNFLSSIAVHNPLALFAALRHFDDGRRPAPDELLHAIRRWLQSPEAQGRSTRHLRWEALAMLAETDASCIPGIVQAFPDHTHYGQRARLRNGDIRGGIELCVNLEPNLHEPRRDADVAHAKLHHGERLVADLNGFLKQEGIGKSARIGALRLAGHIADARLAGAVEVCWNCDGDRERHLAEYLWAFAQCCGDEPARFLKPICDAWATLPDQPKREGILSARVSIAEDELRFAFRRWPPRSAIDYLVSRGSHDDLRWPITSLLRSVDDRSALLFMVGELASVRRQLVGTDSWSPFSHSVVHEWGRAQEDGRRMGDESRRFLLVLWSGEEHDEHIRTSAFLLWSATRGDADLDVLRTVTAPRHLADLIVRERLRRGDELAIPAMIEKLRAGHDYGWWWQFGRYVWSPVLTDELDRFLGTRREHAQRIWGESIAEDWITGELICRLAREDAERLLLKHWDHGRFSPYYVQAALYVATDQLLAAAAGAIEGCPCPERLLRHLSFHMGVRVAGHPGLQGANRISVLAPYLDLVSDGDLFALWQECNERGWFGARRQHLDERLGDAYATRLWNREFLVERLEKALGEEKIHSIDFLIEEYLKANVSWNEILEVLMGWLGGQMSVAALNLVCSAIAHRGRRADLRSLETYRSLGDEAEKIVQDVGFAVRRRAIS